MEMMLDKKQIWAIFFFKFKMGHKAVETTHNINNAFDPETDNECIVWWWFKTFCKGDENLDDEHNGRPSEVHNDHFRTIIEAVPHKLPWEVAEELNVDHSMVVWHSKQIGKVKKLNKWVPYELTTDQKKCHIEASSFYVQQHWTISQLDCDMCWKMDLYNNQQWPAQWLDWEEAAKHFTKPNLHQKKVMVTGGLLPVWSTTAFWILWKPLHLRSMLSKSMRCSEICESCSWHWLTERAKFFSRTTPNCMSHNQCFKSWTNWAMNFLLIYHVHLSEWKSCPTLWEPMDYTVFVILQAWILEWVAFPFSRGSSQPRDQTQVSCITGRFFTSWASREVQEYWSG